MKLKAVVRVQLLFINRFLSSCKELYPVMLFLARYVIMMIGITISFAGRPRIKARIITPSKPNNCPNGSRVFDMLRRRFVP